MEIDRKENLIEKIDCKENLSEISRATDDAGCVVALLSKWKFNQKIGIVQMPVSKTVSVAWSFLQN